MNENYYIGQEAFKNGLGISHAMDTVTEEFDFCYDYWFKGYTDAANRERYDRLHKKSERWWRGEE